METRARMKSIEKDSSRSSLAKAKKVSPEKDDKMKRSKSPENRVSSPEARRKPGDMTPDASRKHLAGRQTSRIRAVHSQTALPSAPPEAGAQLHLRPVNQMVPAPERVVEPPRAPFAVQDRVVECDIFNRETLVQFLNERLYSDMVLVGSDGSEHAVHRIVLARGSEWVHKKLLAEPSAAPPWRVQVPFPDPSRVLPQVIRALYTGQIEITSDSATAINNLARHLEIPSLVKQVAQYLSSTVQRHNCVSMLRQAIELQADDVAEACLNVVARNFPLIKSKEWNWLSYKHFLALLQAEYFQAESEQEVHHLIRSYIEAHKEQLTKEQMRTLQEETRYRFFTLQQMKVAAEDPATPMDLLLEGALARLESYERKEGPMKMLGTKQRLKERQTHGLQFPFTPELAMKGIVHHLATSQNLATSKDYSYVNPHGAGLLQVTVSSVERGQIHELVSSKPTEFWTQPVPASWVCVDFKKYRVRPHHYSLRHGGNHKTDFLRHWDLLGSSDGERWTLLRRHTADNSLRQPFQTCTWEILNCEKSFRFFRVIQTGHNSSRYNFLSISGFELYGELFA